MVSQAWMARLDQLAHPVYLASEENQVLTVHLDHKGPLDQEVRTILTISSSNFGALFNYQT